MESNHYAYISCVILTLRLGFPKLTREPLMNKSALLLLCTTIAIGGCSNVKAQAITTSNKDQVLTDVAKSGLTDEEKKAFLAANLRSAVGEYSLEGKTVSQIIEEQQKYKAEQDAQAAAAHAAQLKAEAARSALLTEMRHAISVQPLSKRYHPSDWENQDFNDMEYVTFQYHNTGAKAIKGFKGTVRFSNSFGDKVIALNLEEGGTGGEAISFKPTTEVTNELGWKVNKFEDNEHVQKYRAKLDARRVGARSDHLRRRYDAQVPRQRITHYPGAALEELQVATKPRSTNTQSRDLISGARNAA
jgi:hypothetical protein